MAFLDILSGAIKTVGSVLHIPGSDQLADAIKPDNIPPEKQAELQAALLVHEEKMKALGIEELKVGIDKLRAETEDMKAVAAESLAMIQSPDKYTSRARPTGVYAATVITAALAVAMICGVKLDTGEIVTLLAPLWGSASFYAYQRTREKLAAQRTA